MKACTCNEKFNLPMLMADDLFGIDGPYWIECDFCGNKTKKWPTEEIAEFKWNEFQYKRSKDRGCALFKKNFSIINCHK